MTKTFRAKPWKTGNSHVATIPSLMIVKGDIDPTKEYDITLDEVSHESNE
jgi:hypothetical protein